MFRYTEEQTEREVVFTVKKAKKTRRGPGFIPMLVLIVLIAVVGVELMQLGGKLKMGRKQIADLEAQSQQVAWENEAMRSDLGKADDLDFMLEKAREAGYVFSNEHIFVDVHGVGD